MACPGEGILTELAKRLLDKTIKEVNYFRHFEAHVLGFEQGHNDLDTRRERLQNDIEDARKRNETKVEADVRKWIDDADSLIQKNKRIKQRWSYGWCPYWQYRQGKRLAQETQVIKGHIQKCDFERLARPGELPGINYHASKDFIDFESRKTKFRQLVEALEGGNHGMIGLQGMGGAGKTTLATQVGKLVEESKAFEKVIFVVVSNPPDVNNIRGEIVRSLGLDLSKKVEADHSKSLWSTISTDKRKLLIILDDVWEKLDLAEIGIPFGPDHKNCYVLITTRHSKVCEAMRCHQIIRLHTLDDEDALRLFLSHSRSNDSEDLAQDFVKECGGLPVAIVALAGALRNWPVGEWNVALTTLKNSKQFVDVDEDLVTVYRCLKLSYDNLNDDKAQRLFLLCSVFPEDYEIPINLVIRLGIGLGIFGEADKYYATKAQALVVKNKLIASSLLLKVEEKECVKMHDLVREVAQWMAKEDIQVITDSRTALKANTQFVFWSAEDFPDQFDDTKLEILFLWISGNVLVKDPNAFFAGMSRLKILFLLGKHVSKTPTLSLSQSLLSLKNIQTLILDGWEIGDISVLKNLQSLVTLELKKCMISKLPKDIMELKKLRWLGLRMCQIQKNNPFELIERCSQLEELYFVGNHNVKDWKPEDDKEIEDGIVSDISPSALQVFSIACAGFRCFGNDDNGLLKCFNSEHMKHLISEAMFKYLVGRAEVLELGNLGQTEWKSLVPDVIPAEDGGKDNLVKLYLYEWVDIEFLIDTHKYHYSNLTAFSNLVELHLYGVGVKELCHGAMPSGFLEKLQILELEDCRELQNIFLDENLRLPHVKVLKLKDCPMFQPSIFKSSVARSLRQLEELVISDCKEIKNLIADDGLEEEIMVVDYKKRHGFLFPELKSLQIGGCGKLESFINIFQECKTCVPRPPHQVSKEDSRERQKNSKTSAFSWAHRCCFLAPTKDTNIGSSDATLLEDRRISQESSCAPSSKKIAECLMRQPLSLLNIRQMRLDGCSKLKSLFSVSIATTIMLEELKIVNCEELKHIITNEAEDDDARLNCTSIFPKLQSLQVLFCNKLEFIFPSALSGGLQQLKSIGISGAKELKYVFGKYDDDEERVSNENENNEPHIHLPALESLRIDNVPNMISVGINRRQPACPSLQIVEAPKETKKHMHDVISEGAKEFEIQETVNIETPLPPSVAFQHVLNFCNIKKIEIWGNKKLKTLFSISACRNLPQLSKLYINECEELVNVVEDDSNDHHHVNYSSIFPKLEYLYISKCNKLEFIFPLSLFGTLQKLKSLSIWRAAELKYIFGKYYDDGDYLSNENESDALRIHLPALEELSLVDGPKLINIIRAKKYHLSFPRLQSIQLGGLQEFNGRSFPDLMARLQGIQLNVKAPKDLMKIIMDLQKLRNLDVIDSKIKEVLNLEGVEIEGQVMTLSLEEMWLQNLSELRHICRGPKYILSLSNLQQLTITACKKLRAILCVSIVKSLPQLSYLWIKDCDGLVDIIEESDGDPLHQLCFPKLEEINIEGCNSLKCLFSVSICVVFPKLGILKIKKACELEQIFICKQDDMQKMAKMEEVFPNLSKVTLRELPRLIAICEGIDFKDLQCCEVEDCPKYQAAASHIQKEPKNGDPENQATSVLPEVAESSKEAMKRRFEEVASSMGEEKTVKEIEAKDPTPTLEDQALEGSTAKPHLRRTSLHNYKETEKEIGRVVPDTADSKLPATTSSTFQELEDEDKTRESTTQLQQEDLAETKITKASQKTNVPFDDNSIGIISKERAEGDATSEDVVVAAMVADLAPRNSSEALIIPHQKETPLDLKLSESRSETSMKHQEELPDRMNVTSPIVCVRVSQSGPSTFVASMKEKHEQGSQEDDATEEATIAVKSTDSDSRKKTRISSIIAQSSEETEKGTLRIHASQLSTAPISTNSEIIQSIKDTTQQGHEENYVEDDAVTAVGSTISDSRKQSPIDNLSGKDSAPRAKKMTKGIDEKATATDTSPTTVIETGDHPSVQEEAASEKPIKAILSQVIPSLHHQSQTADDTGTSSSKLGVCEIFQLVELKDGETALLAHALERYPQLLLPQEHRSQRMMAWSYRVLVDILVVLATKTPYNITSSEKSTLEANLCDATLLGFEKEWVDSVRSRVFGVDISDVLVAEEEIQVKEAELGTCDIALEQVRKQRVEARERRAVARRQLEMAQTEFEAIDSQLSGLLEDREKLITEITKFREVISAKNRPFGI